MRRCRACSVGLSVGEVVCALIASRLCSPSPLYDVAGGRPVPRCTSCWGSAGCSTMIASVELWRRSPSTQRISAQGSRGRDRAVRCDRGPAACRLSRSQWQALMSTLP